MLVCRAVVLAAVLQSGLLTAYVGSFTPPLGSLAEGVPGRKNGIGVGPNGKIGGFAEEIPAVNVFAGPANAATGVHCVPGFGQFVRSQSN